MKKHFKKLLLSGFLLSTVLFLSGCMRYDDAGNPAGWFYDLLVLPTISSINWLADLFGGSYGLAIIALTFIVRLIILPLTLKQQRGTTVQQVKMNAVKDVTSEIQAELKATDDPARQQELQQEMMSVYKDAGISVTGGVGCLPLLIQLPIISAVFQAIRNSQEIASASFLGIELGERSIILAVLAGLVFLLQSWMTSKSLPEEQRGQMGAMLWMNPVMIFVFSLSSPAGIALYWIAGGLFAAVQTFAINRFIKPRLEEEALAEVGEINVTRKKSAKRPEAEKVDGGPVNASEKKRRNRNKSTFERKGGKRRNEGKQNNHRK